MWADFKFSGANGTERTDLRVPNLRADICAVPPDGDVHLTFVNPDGRILRVAMTGDDAEQLGKRLQFIAEV